jgi:hypothetical protein
MELACAGPVHGRPSMAATAGRNPRAGKASGDSGRPAGPSLLTASIEYSASRAAISAHPPARTYVPELTPSPAPPAGYATWHQATV